MDLLALSIIHHYGNGVSFVFPTTISMSHYGRLQLVRLSRASNEVMRKRLHRGKEWSARHDLPVLGRTYSRGTPTSLALDLV